MQLRTEGAVIVNHANPLKITKIGSEYVDTAKVGGRPGSSKGVWISTDRGNTCQMGIIIIDFDPKRFKSLEPLEPAKRLAFNYSPGLTRMSMESCCL